MSGRVGTRTVSVYDVADPPNTDPGRRELRSDPCKHQASPVLTEIHLADASGGSVLVQPGTVHVDTLPLSQRSLLFRSDRGNCNDVARSCALQPMKANSSDWYARGAEVESSKDEFSEDGKEERAFTLPVTWHGPSFLKFSSYATAWAVYHWNPAYLHCTA